MNIDGIIVTSLLTCLGQILQKKAALSVTRRAIILWFGLSILSLTLGMSVWLWVLQSTPVSQAYPMMALNFVWVTLAAKLIWKERITTGHWVGILFILSGVILLTGASSWGW